MTQTTTPATSADGTPGTMSHRQIMVVFSGLMLGLLLAALDQTIVSTALWTIVKDLDPVNGISHMSWVITAYLLASTASTPLYGKISDLFGRKPVYMFAIALFVLGSILSGLSQNMGELITFRAVQGLGAGGLMGLTFAIIGDVVAPRERGRYQGYFGGVFALASVAGPLLGGFFTDRHALFGLATNWRWVFYINVPLGVAALMVVSTVLRMSTQRRQHTIDYAGAATMVAGVSALLMVTVWGGARYAWTSPTIIGLILGGLGLLGVFVWIQSRAVEPILPLHLFRTSVFRVANAISFIIGFAMFGTIIYISLYLQIVDNATPTAAGLRLLPLMVGVLGASITSGRMISRMGRYKIFPILGTGVATVGMGLLGLLRSDTGSVLLSLYMFVLGVGLGLVMQVLVLAVQNAVNPRDMGTATTATTFFRSMGGSFGTAVFGAILTNRLSANLPHTLAGQAGGPPNPAKLQALPPAVRQLVIDAFVRATNVVFLTAAAVILVAFALSFLLKEIRLRGADEQHAGAREARLEPTPDAVG
jgi:EmrB/QacA subfamily drug resistance transporter